MLRCHGERIPWFHSEMIPWCPNKRIPWCNVKEYHRFMDISRILRNHVMMTYIMFMNDTLTRVAEQAAGKLLYYEYAKKSPVMLDMYR